MNNSSEIRTEGTSRLLHLGMFPPAPRRNETKEMIPLQSVPALDFSLMTYLLCLALYLMSYILYSCKLVCL